MEGFLVSVIAVVVVGIPVLLIIFMVWTNKLAQRVRTLEAEMRALREGQGALPADRPAALPEPPKPAGTEPEPPEGPWQAPQAAAPTKAKTPAPAQRPAPARAEGPPKAVVMRADTARALGNWLKANWIYVVSAVSLAFAGLFFVQYGIETGLLTPPARVAAALVFGLALVVAGEVVRRRWGDRDDVTTAYIPSVFSGAGIVTLFGAVLAALHLYALISPGMGLAGLVAVAALAIVLGWYSGPLLAALGVIGAFTAPFLVGGDSAHPELFYGYFALVALVGLAIDAGRRWAWLSVLALAGGYPAVTLLWLEADWPELYALVLVGLVLASMAVPTFAPVPRHGGAAIIESFAKGRPRGWPVFPTRLVAGSMVASVAGLAMLGLSGEVEFWLAAIGFAVLVFALAIWAQGAEALEDLAVLPALALVGLPVAVMVARAEPYIGFRAWLGAEEGTPVPNAPYLLVSLGLAVTLMAAVRSHLGARWPVAWGAGAALVAPVMVGGLEFAWSPGDVLGAYPWALVVIGVAAVMVVLALVFVRHDGPSRPRVAGFALAAFALIALAMALLFTKTALTLSFAVLTVAAAALDRRFTLRPLSVAVQAGALALGWRLVVDPGVDWASYAPIWEVVLSYGGGLAALGASLWLLRPLHRPVAMIVAESAMSSLAAIFASILLYRAIEAGLPDAGTLSHWYFGLLAVIWLSAAAAQLWRTQAGGVLGRVRYVLAGLFGLIGACMLGVAALPFNPALEGMAENLVRGAIVLNTLIPAYLLPALPIAFVAWRFRFLNRRPRMGLGAAVALVTALWLFLAIRHGWRGDDMAAPDFTDPELYTYTIALLLIGAGLLYQAMARRSGLLRKVAMGVIALTIAKVFLVDISGLVGLLRVFSFLALGLALAGLAFLNRWAASHTRRESAESDAD